MSWNVGQRTTVLNSRMDQDITERKETDPTLSKGCLYCSDESRKAISCDNIVNSGERKKILAEKQLCSNCARTKHRAADCKSKRVGHAMVTSHVYL